MSERVYYNKLVWDNVPDIIHAKGKECEVRILDNEEFRVELLKKVEEEASALPETTSKQELIDELADVITVVEYIKQLEDISELEIADALERHARLRGRFERKQFLVWSSDSTYVTNEKSKTVVRLTIPDEKPESSGRTE
ncbi:MAG: nucleoside triphosphate pyrophosphohydrolase [Candidatus Pacebacteria bacterium]|nr:nucleoside triphosphate pyrophosphohydrolase [Candidatus Paceibacterota bacterium]